MSTTTSNVTYRFGFYLQQGDNLEDAFFSFTNACGMDDASALALAEAMKNVEWPAGTTVSMTVERNDTTNVHSGGDLNATPPTFT
ncbi:MAG: hypothetical protein HOY79_34075 [Streptomyces sp.]|nr:hypothetical protein [Streptomyces sp.]NUS11414.1 hypothetical protein [Streptomyces sp.]NUS23445.1 hypothetical protein [Streptomyces sp.]